MHRTTPTTPTSAFFTSRPTTRDGTEPAMPTSPPPPVPGARKPSFSRKSSLSGMSRRRGSSVGATPQPSVVTNAAAPPALPTYALPAAARVQSKDGVMSPISPEGTRPGTANASYGPPTPVWQPSEASVIHQQMIEVASKRISTLDYLRKAHEGRVYWFNTYLFERPDLARMPFFDPRKLARKATNYLLLGLSIPTINDLYSSSPIEFLRCLNALLSEFDAFQQLHSDSASRARLPTMFRRPVGKSRRSASVAEMHLDESHAFPTPGTSAPSVINFAASESDLLPGEEYTYLLTPSLPFDPDFFETFATLCDVLVDCYSRFLALVPTPRECSSPVAELFTKADAKMRKIIVQGVVKEFEDQSKGHVKTEVASIGKVVLGGLM